MTAEDDGDDNFVRRENETDEEAKARKRKERLEQNRISARESRKRKKTMIEELQRTVITLSRENKDLNERNESLRRQLMELAGKYPNVVPMQAIMGQAAANGTGSTVTASTGGTAPTDVAAAAASGAVGSFNPMAWLQQQQAAAAAAPPAAVEAAPASEAKAENDAAAE